MQVKGNYWMHLLYSYYHAHITTKWGVTANILFPYIEPAYINLVVTVTRKGYYFGINIIVYHFAGANQIEMDSGGIGSQIRAQTRVIERLWVLYPDSGCSCPSHRKRVFLCVIFKGILWVQSDTSCLIMSIVLSWNRILYMIKIEKNLTMSFDNGM